jgi:hypothetical protein
MQTTTYILVEYVFIIYPQLHASALYFNIRTLSLKRAEEAKICREVK